MSKRFPFVPPSPPGPDLSSIKEVISVIGEDIKRDAAEINEAIANPPVLPGSRTTILPRKMEAKDVSVAKLRAIIERAKKGPLTEEITQDKPANPGSQPQVRAKGVSDENTIRYQNIELAKELLLLDKHLQQGCAIFGKPCDCCEKHPLTIQALAEETYGITSNPLYMSIAAWAGAMGPFVDAQAPRDESALRRYAGWSLDAREYRKALMGSGYVAEISPDRRKAYVDAFMRQMTDRLGPAVMSQLKQGGKKS